MLGLCNFSCAFSVGSEVFFWVRYFIFCLSKLHCHSVFSVSFFNLLVGSLECKRKLFTATNARNLFQYLSEYIITTVVPLSA